MGQNYFLTFVPLYWYKGWLSMIGFLGQPLVWTLDNGQPLVLTWDSYRHGTATDMGQTLVRTCDIIQTWDNHLSEPKTVGHCPGMHGTATFTDMGQPLVRTWDIVQTWDNHLSVPGTATCPYLPVSDCSSVSKLPRLLCSHKSRLALSAGFISGSCRW